MKIVHISDTHGRHRKLDEKLIDADVIVHSGDVCGDVDSERDAKDFLTWFSNLDYKHKIFVPGNHDFFFENLVVDSLLRKDLIPNNIHLLLGDSIEIEGVKFYGSPYLNLFNDWAFHLENTELHAHWEQIPDDVEVLVTHTPKYSVLDMQRVQYRINNAGCKCLQYRIEQLPNLKAHLFGHIHEANGIVEREGVTYSNAATKLHVLKIHEKLE